MAGFVKVARRDEIADGTGKVVEVNGLLVALFNSGGQFYAIDNACLHLGAPLGDGEVYGTRVICPLHGWEYDFTTGRNVDDPAMKLRCHAVKIEGDDVLVEAAGFSGRG
jgi:nitrite reductase/ring-hydroxylating ferredoxin subunit